jgi:hypothetical protein
MVREPKLKFTVNLYVPSCHPSILAPHPASSFLYPHSSASRPANLREPRSPNVSFVLATASPVYSQVSEQAIIVDMSNILVRKVRSVKHSDLHLKRDRLVHSPFAVSHPIAINMRSLSKHQTSFPESSATQTCSLINRYKGRRFLF